MIRPLAAACLALLALTACSPASEGGTASVSPSPAPTSASASPTPEASSASPEPSEILAVLCDSATKEQIAILEAAMKPGYKVSKIVDVRTREGGEHALLGIVKGPDASGPARWIGSKVALEDLQSADAAAAASSTAPLMTAPSEDAIDYLNQTQTCFEAIHE